MPRAKPILELIARCLIYTLIIMLATVIVVVVFTRDLTEILLYLSYALLVEGGLMLVVGGVMANFSSTINKIGEIIVHSEPWDAKHQKEAEITAKSWITAGVFLFLLGLLVSVF